MNRRDLIILLLARGMTAPRALRAHQKAMPVIGYLNGTSPAATITVNVSAAPLIKLDFSERNPRLNPGDGRPPGLQALDQFRVGLAVLLDRDAEAVDRELRVQGPEEFAPGVGLGGLEVDADPELATDLLHIRRPPLVCEARIARDHDQPAQPR